MPTQDDVRDDDRYVLLHDHGFVGLVETMGSDEAVEQSARISYGSGTRKKSDTRNLLRYLVRNHHTSPLEMCEVKFHIKLPIFVMRQLVRHRTASLNEYSGRYSEMSDDFYMPKVDYLSPQSNTNKQGRDDDEEFSGVEQSTMLHHMRTARNVSKFSYRNLLDMNLSRELARTILPVSNYTECYWKIDLKNFMGFLKLRCDDHAQREIRDFAWAMHKLAKPHFPILFEAWNDYIWEAKTFSIMELTLMGYMMLNGNDWDGAVADLPPRLEMSKRELNDLRKKLDDTWPDFELCLSVNDLTEKLSVANAPMPNNEDLL
jgi:thymidylate synthase (FAD)